MKDDPQSTERSGESDSPDLKLRVVLEYLRHPNRRKQLCKQYHITDTQLLAWHHEFMDRVGEVFRHSHSLPTHSEDTTVSTSPLTPPRFERPVPREKPLGGMHIKKSPGIAVQTPSSSETTPSWLGNAERKAWMESAVVVWDEGTRKFETLTARQALDLLENLRERGYWRTEGIPITSRFYQLKDLPVPEGGASRVQAEVPFQLGNRDYEAVDEVLFRLHPDLGEEVFAFLQENESLLKQLAEAQRKEALQTFKLMFTQLLEPIYEQQETAIDLATRPCNWVRQPHSRNYVCDHGLNRATIHLGEMGILWQGCLERPDRFKQWTTPFAALADALSWAERELLAPDRISLDSTERVPAPDKESSPKETRVDLTQYRINSAALEPPSLTYRIVLEMNHAPESFRTAEMSFGKLYRYAEVFPVASKVAHELSLDLTQFAIEQPLGPNHDRSRIVSLESHDRAADAETQARQLWNQSDCAELYKQGKIRRARYGYQEVETSYYTWLGELEDPQEPWSQPKSRSEHMAERAKTETMINALDVAGVRWAMGFAADNLSDAEILRLLHQLRTQSVAIPEKARAESIVWLHDHPKATTSEPVATGDGFGVTRSGGEAAQRRSKVKRSAKSTKTKSYAQKRRIK